MHPGAATFAGDARLGGLPAGERRLLSFAQDLRTTVERSSTGETTLASLTAAQGVLHITTRQREVLRVTITGPANEPRRVLVEIPKEGDRTLTLEGGPIPGVEETATAWRVPVSLKPGEVRKLTASIDRLEREQTALLADDAAGGRAAAERADVDPGGTHGVAAAGRAAAGRGSEAGDGRPAQGAAGGGPAGRGPHPPQPRRGARPTTHCTPG